MSLRFSFRNFLARLQGGPARFRRKHHSRPWCPLPQQGGVLRERNVQPFAVRTGQACLDLGLQILGKRGSTFDSRRPSCNIQLHQSKKMRQNREISAGLGLKHLLNRLANTVFFQQPGDNATAKQLLCFAPCLFGDLHSATCFAVSSASRRWSSGVKILPVTVAVVWTTRRPTSRFSSASMRA